MQPDMELRRALEAVRGLSEQSPSWNSVLSTANRLVGSDAAVLIVFNGESVVDVQQSGADAAAVRDYAGHFHTEDVMTLPSVVKPPGTWLDTQILLPEQRRQRSAYYVDFMCKHRMRQLYSFIIENSPDRRTSLGFQRESAWDGLSSFLAGERIRTYTQALQQAVERRRAHAASWLATTDHAFDALAEASCLAHSSGQIVHASPAAKELFDSRGSVIVTGGRISHPDPKDRAQLQASLLSAGVTDKVQQLVFRDSRTGLPVHLELVCANPLLRMGREPLVFIRLRRAGQQAVASPERLMQPLGITLAEARVLHALASGLSVSNYAESNGVSIHTVRKQVAALMIKIDCSRQVDLVRTALNVRH
ncbi:MULTISPECIES: helix-turn-helix transcriptional regulator [unclassified Variovorax]|uniref:helix-turn-helix transcriptional regulator n=1 Tax=unclassified Variovorax TaxID=663243 RepID=UPI0032E57FD0